ncbi:MerR family transcriptional regulator [Fulvivirga sp. M361]|uniref:MerR family transcriptional regulator n=1 Tax=Fulvivirga sp. M361 TaxID=2594266 RepID=UPI0011799C40|nr:MerR family transcriptional regulator [Fulvivirga sp. M361]TRX57552.1 MerR family transcriptional regulator [Fulvivirga sp. M361]
MGNYSIKELEKLSGIKAHTIRIWEKRHQIIDPKRTDTNIRFYSDDDLKKILNVSILNNNGYKISYIADLSIKELTNTVKQLSEEKTDAALFIDQLTICMIDFDEVGFEKKLAGFILKIGFERTLLEIIYPFLTKIGVLWLSGNISPIQEHFITNLIRQKIIVAIDGLDVKTDENAKKVAFFLPENEMHEIGLLFFHYLLKKLKFKTYYLGQYVPFDDLVKSVEIIQPDMMVASISYSPSARQLNQFLKNLAETFNGTDIYITGQSQLKQSLSQFKNLHFFEDALALKELFSSKI